MSLKTNYKDEMLKSGEQRRYNLVASNGSTLYSNVRLEKAYTPQVEGDKFSAKDINDTNKAINDINDSMKYSLSAEQYTGQRWLNGEKIYRKIITWNNITSGVKNVAHGISNIKEFVNYDVTLMVIRHFINYLLFIIQMPILVHSMIYMLELIILILK